MKLAEHQRIVQGRLSRRRDRQPFAMMRKAFGLRTTNGHPHQDSNLEPLPLEAARADSPLHLVGF